MRVTQICLEDLSLFFVFVIEGYLGVLVFGLVSVPIYHLCISIFVSEICSPSSLVDAS